MKENKELTAILEFIKIKLEDANIIYKELETKLHTSDKEETANEINQIMMFADYYGHQKEKEGEYEEALKYYHIALNFSLLYKESIYAKRSNRTLAISNYVISRVNLTMADYKSFEHYFNEFVYYQVEAITNDNQKEETHNFINDFKKLFISLIVINKIQLEKIFNNLIIAFEDLYSKNKITKITKHEIISTIIFFQIIFKLDLSETNIKRHLNYVEQIIDTIEKRDIVKTIYDQIATLKSSVLIPKRFQNEYKKHYQNLNLNQENITDTIRIFISNNYTNFEKERDIINNIVLPEMRDFCMENYKLNFEIIDNYLESQNNTHKNLFLAGEMIELARPYFMFFISDNYENKIEADLLNYLYNDLNINNNINITEVEYLLSDITEKTNNTFFLFTKDKENIINKNSLNLLEKIEEKVLSENTFNYQKADINLALKIIDYLKNSIIQNYKNINNNNLISDILKRSANKMVGFEKELKLYHKLLNNNTPIIAVHSDHGGGKTTFLAKAYLETEKENYYTFSYLVKNAGGDIFEHELIDYVRRAVESVLHVDSIKNESLPYNIKRLHELMKMLDDETKIVFFIDDYEHQTFSSEPFSWYTDDFNKLTFVYTSSDSTLIAKTLMQGSIPIQLSNMEEDFDLFVVKKFKDKFNDVSSDIINQLFSKLKYLNIRYNPSYINELINSLIYLNEDDYNNINEDVFNNNISFNNAIVNYQEKIIDQFPESLEQYYKDKIDELITSNLYNAFLLAYLSLSGNFGVTLDEINKVLEELNSNNKYTSFLSVKYILNDLVETESFNYIVIKSDGFTKAIFKHLDEKVLTLVSNHIIINNKYIDSATINSLLYLNKFTALSMFFTQNDFMIRHLIINTIYKYKGETDKGLEFINNIYINDITPIYLMWNLIDNELENDYLISRKKKYSKAMTNRLNPLLNESDNEYFDLYFLASKYLVKFNDQEDLEFHYDFILSNMSKFNYESLYLYEYLVELINKTTRLKDGLLLISKLYESIMPYIEKTNYKYPDTSMEVLKLLHIIFSLFTDQDTHYLEQYEKFHDAEFGEELDINNPEKQIKQVFFIAAEYIKLGQFELGYTYYDHILELLNNPNLLYPQTTTLISIDSKITNDLGNYNLVTLLRDFKKNKEIFDEDKAYYDQLKEDTKYLLNKSCYKTQSLFNAKQDNESLYNDLVSNLNLSIYLVTFEEEFKKAFEIMNQKIVSMISLVQKELIIIDYFIYYLLHKQIFMDYKKIYDIDLKETLKLFVNELNEHDIVFDNLDLAHILLVSESQLSHYDIGKSEEYIELEKIIMDFVDKFRR